MRCNHILQGIRVASTDELREIKLRLFVFFKYQFIEYFTTILYKSDGILEFQKKFENDKIYVKAMLILACSVF